MSEAGDSGELGELVEGRGLLGWALRATRKASEGRWGVWVLGVASFLDSVISPLPPDVFLAPMAMTSREKAWFFGSVCTATSVLGGVLGYVLGGWLFAEFGLGTLAFLGLEGEYMEFLGYVERWGWFAVLVCSVTFLPYKAAAFGAGAVELGLVLFVLTSLLGRGSRFFAVAWLARRFGVAAQRALTGRFGWLCVGIFVVLAGVLALWNW